MEKDRGKPRKGGLARIVTAPGIRAVAARTIGFLGRLAGFSSDRDDAGSDALLREMVDFIPDLLWSADAKGSADWFNGRWLDYTGQSMAEAQGSGWLDAVHADERREAGSRFRAAVAAGTPLVMELGISRKDGSVRRFLLRLHPSRNASGKVVRWLAAATDLHDQHVAKEALEASERRASLLIHELQHRVRNVLSVMRSIAQRTAANSESLDDYVMHLEGRLNALARVHSAVARDPRGGVGLELLIAEELHAHGAEEGVQVNEINGPEVQLKPKAAQLIALAVHELTVNAIKFGALAASTGRISIGWKVDGPAGTPALILTWRESGVELVEREPQRRGFGCELLERSLPYELHGEAAMSFEPDGMHCTLTIPISKRLVADAGIVA